MDNSKGACAAGSEADLSGKSKEEATAWCKNEKDGEPMMMVDDKGRCSCCPIKCGPESDNELLQSTIMDAKSMCEASSWSGSKLHLNGGTSAA